MRRTFLPLLLAACGGARDLEATNDTGGNYAPPTDADADTDADTDTDLPPEEESDFLRLAPAATDVYVFVANPDRGTVTRITVPELELETRAVGVDPRVVATTSDYRRAVVLNAGSDDVAIIDAASFEVVNVGVRDHFNSLSLSTDGQWAMAWHDVDAEEDGDEADGVQSYNEVSFVRLGDATHFPMAVGYNPHGVRWTPDGTRALVVSDAALVLVDLTVDPPSPTLIEIDDDPLDAPPAEEVELTPDGRWAWVRQFGSDTILLVSMDDLSITSLPAGSNPTDLDLSPDGLEVAVVSRGSSELRLFDVADPYAEPRLYAFDPATPYGSMVYAGETGRAVLYTNASLLPKYGLWDAATGTVESKTLVKPVSSIGLSGTGESMLVFHTLADAAGADPTSDFYGRWALTMVRLDDGGQNPLLLDAEPSGYAVSDDGAYGFFLMKDQPWLESLSFDELLYEEIKLKSDPVHVGTLPGTDIAYASQEHDLGRISFWNPVAETLDTVTGFELNSEIDHED